MLKSDFGKVAENYARSRDDIPAILFESLQMRNVSFEGKRVADLACGTGALTRKLKLRKAEVVGVEPSQELLEEAKKINERKFLLVPYQLGTAENTQLPSNEFDMVTVMRAWHWFKRQESLTEIKRILKDKGRLIIADSGFVPEHEVVSTTFSIIKQYVSEIKPAGSKADSKQRMNGFPVEWFEEWSLNGFDLRDFYKLDYEVSFTNEQWVDRVASLSFIASLDLTKRNLLLDELSAVLNSQYSTHHIHIIPHICTIVILNR